MCEGGFPASTAKQVIQLAPTQARHCHPIYTHWGHWRGFRLWGFEGFPNICGLLCGPEVGGHYNVCLSMGYCGENGGDVGRVLLLPIRGPCIRLTLISLARLGRIPWTIVFGFMAVSLCCAEGAWEPEPGPVCMHVCHGRWPLLSGPGVVLPAPGPAARAGPWPVAAVYTRIAPYTRPVLATIAWPLVQIAFGRPIVAGRPMLARGPYWPRARARVDEFHHRSAYSMFHSAGPPLAATAARGGRHWLQLRPAATATGCK